MPTPPVKDVSQSPTQPQFQLGASSDEAVTALQIQRMPLEGPGGIVKRLGQQFEMPRSQPDSSISRDMHGED